MSTPTNERRPVIITGVNIPFVDMVKLLITVAIAAIPAAIIISFVMFAVGMIFAMFFGGIGALMN